LSRGKNEESALSRYDELLQEFMNLAINRFSWSGLPVGLTSEQLEKLLITKGQLMFYKDSELGNILLPCYATSEINPYGLPTKYHVNAENGEFNKTIDTEKGVIIRNNPQGFPDFPTLVIFAKRIDDVEMTQDVNLFQQCIPKIVLADEDSKLTAKTLIDKIKEFKFVVFGKKSLVTNVSTSDVLDTSSPFLLDKLQQHKTELKNELLTFLGINNNNNIKKERMIVDEVNANNDYISINLDLMFDLRKKACDEINTKFGTQLKVEKRKVEEVGEVHNNNTGDN
jgi:hypothetical protein